MVRLQKMLIDRSASRGCWRSRADRWAACRRCSGRWQYPDAVVAAIPIASTARHSAQQIAFNEVGRQAIMADPDWNEGNYYGKQPPARGLAVARMVGHITYMSDDSMREKFGRRLRGKEAFGFGFDVDFEVESYLRYRGSQFVTRFDANSYLYITKAMDYFDLTGGNGSIAAALEPARARFLVISFSSDWLYPSYQSQEMVRALRSRNRDVAYVELQSNYGHDSFLVDVAEQSALVAGFPLDHVRETGMSAQAARRLHLSTTCSGAAITRSSATSSSRRAACSTSAAARASCSNGSRANKGVDARGVEISGAKVQRAIARGVSVFQCDIDQALADYPDQAFDYVILSQTLQETLRPRQVLREMLRVGRRGIVAFPNFGHWSVRLSMLLSGRAPRTQLFPYEWYESPNIHFLTVQDFEDLAQAEGLTVERRYFLAGHRKVTALPNLLAETAVYLVAGRAA